MTKHSHRVIKKKVEGRQLYLRQLKAKLVLMGTTQRQVAEEVKVSFGHVCHILAGRRHNERVIKYIEEMK